jgi:TetR/AcrR family transcriptional regulator, transcriptional repressor for nem operon
MSKAEKTREYIIEKAAPIFNMKGYAGTSLQDLTKATGLTKGSIYGNFKNKDEVAVAVYKHSVALLDQRITAFLEPRNSMLDKLLGIVDYYRTNWKQIFEKGGCPMQNASVEADDTLSVLKKPVQTSIRNWVKGIGLVIEKGQRKGEFKKSIEAEEYAYAIITLLEGGIMLGKIMNSQKLLFSALDRIETMIHQEIKKK